MSETTETTTPAPPAAKGEETQRPGKKGERGFLLRKLRDTEKALEKEKSIADQFRSKEAEFTQTLTQLQSQQKQEKIQFLFEKAAAAAGAHDSDAAFKLADLSKVSLDESGALKGVDDVLKSLKESRSYLFGQPAATGSAGGNPPSGTHLPELTSERIRKMSSEDFAKLHGSLQSGQIRFPR